MANYNSLEDVGFNNAAKKAATPVATPTPTPLKDIGFNLAAERASKPVAPPVVIAPTYVDDIFKRDKDTGNYKNVTSVVTKPAQIVIKAEPTTPATPAVNSVAPAATVKTAPIDTVLFNDDSVPIEVMTDLLFENIGGHELINIARNDIINGQKVSYQPIKNISSIQQQYNPNNILGLQNTSDKYFSNFSIKLENKIPNTGSGPNGSNVYLDSQTGDLVIETVNIEKDEQIEIEITIGATIYEAEFGEITS
jgi:hypothetical protein